MNAATEGCGDIGLKGPSLPSHSPSVQVLVPPTVVLDLESGFSGARETELMRKGDMAIDSGAEFPICPDVTFIQWFICWILFVAGLYKQSTNSHKIIQKN